MEQSIIIETLKSYLTPNFHVSFEDGGIDILSPNKTLGAKVILGKGLKPGDIGVAGRMISQSFTNKAWEIL